MYFALRLHHRAGSDPLELHGTVYTVICIDCGYSFCRSLFQDQLKDLNPKVSNLGLFYRSICIVNQQMLKKRFLYLRNANEVYGRQSHDIYPFIPMESVSSSRKI